MKRKIFAAFFAALVCAVPMSGQTSLPAGAAPMIVTSHLQDINYRERTLCPDIAANVAYETSCDQDWVTVINKGGRIYLHVAANYNPMSRTATVSFKNAEHGITQTMSIVQGADESVNEIPSDITVKPSSGTGSAAASGNPFSYSFDGKLSTFYHTAYSGSNAFKVSETNPAVLTYNFSNVERIDYVNYVPRQDGSSNGNFGKVEVYYRLQGEKSFTLYDTYDWGKSSSVSVVNFDKLGGLKNPASVQFKVYSGEGDYASCAEMQFFEKSDDASLSEFDIFGDDVYSTLREGVTETDIKKLTNPFVKSLAEAIYSGTYSTKYRVAEYPCLLSVETLASMWNTPGKYYDQFAGVTGISFAPGTYAVAVSGLPAGKSATLKIVAWYNGYEGSNFDGGNPQTTTFTLTNGINKIEYNPAANLTFSGSYKSDYDGLAYIDYHASENPESQPAIKVHFIKGVVNGYLSEDMTNDEMYTLLGEAKNKHMDVVSAKAHAVWTSKGLRNYCKAVDGSLGYRQYMNVLDSLVQWEHDLLGFTKYNRLPNNRTFAYVNYTYYMFQGGYGVSFHVDQESRILNCNTLINKDDDAIWGLSHEWGHQHQMHPYFCWSGMTEVTNNMNSYYNIMKMGYRTSDKINNWASARKHMVEDNWSGTTMTSGQRTNAYDAASRYSWCDDYNKLCLEMKDNAMTTQADNVLRAPAVTEISGGETLCPFIMLYAYFTKNGFPDFAPDWYEALRQTDQEGGSTIEKKDGYDKYELVASAQNGNKNDAIAKLNEKYPNSVWCKYITKEHCAQKDNAMPYVLNFIRKTSRLSGYNLFPYFERWGFLRNVALGIDDYGMGYSLFPKAAYDEFKADMDALVADGTLKAMPEDMVEAVSTTEDLFQSKPMFPN